MAFIEKMLGQLISTNIIRYKIVLVLVSYNYLCQQSKVPN